MDRWIFIKVYLIFKFGVLRYNLNTKFFKILIERSKDDYEKESFINCIKRE